MKIERLRIASVRGIRRELALELEGASLVLRGDNGTGKTSIVSGLLWALRGEHEPLSTAKADSEEAYRANVLDGPKASQVVVELKGGGSLKVVPGKLDADDAGQALRASCARSSPFLLRKQLLRFLEDRPIDRFKYLEAFLDIDEADRAFDGVQSRGREHEARAQAHRQTLERHLRDLSAQTPRDLVPTAWTWANAVKGLVGWAERLEVASDGASWAELVALGDRLTQLLQGEELARKRAGAGASLG